MRLFYNSLSSNYSNPDPDISYAFSSVIINDTNWIVQSKDNMQIRVSDLLIETSIDTGLTFPYSYSFNKASRIKTAWIFGNGNILIFLFDYTVYLTNITLSSFVEKTIYGVDGITEIPFIDINSYGYSNYYIPLTYPDSNSVPDTDYLWGAYSNVPNIGTDVYILSTQDSGENIKAIHAYSGVLGDNPRHIHICEYNSFEEKWYISTGDNPPANDILWATVDRATLTFTNIDFGVDSPLVSGRMKNAGIYFRQIGGVNYIYFGAENDNLPSSEIGIWRSKTSEFNNLSLHERILAFTIEENYKVVDLRVNPLNGLVCGILGKQAVFNASNKILIAEDYGHGGYDVKFYNGNRFRGMSGLDANGFYRIDTDFLDTLQGNSFLIKAGLDLFNTFNKTNTVVGTFDDMVVTSSLGIVTASITVSDDVSSNQNLYFNLYDDGTLIHRSGTHNNDADVTELLGDITINNIKIATNRSYDFTLSCVDLDGNETFLTNTVNVVVPSDGVAPILSNFRVNDDRPKNVFFDSSEPITVTNDLDGVAGFTITNKTNLKIVYIPNELTGHYFSFVQEFFHGDNETISYVGGSNLADLDSVPLAPFSATVINNSTIQL